jgi:uncharacterized protein YjbI with pentapeptide repeats
MSLSKRLFYNVFVTNGSLTADIISSRSTVTNSVLTGMSVSNANVSNATVNNFISSNSSISSLISLNITGTNLITTNLTTSNLTSVIGNFSTVASSFISVTTMTGGNLSLSGNLIIGGTLTTVNITTTNITDTNLTSGNINVTSLATINNAALTTSTIATLLNTNQNVTNVTASTINVSTGITAPSINITNATVATARITSNLICLGNSNTIGNIFTTGGNVGIGSTGPSTTLQVNGGISASATNTITNQGIHLQWNRSNGDGESWIVNQKGGGTVNSGIRFGRADTSNNVTELMRIQDSGNVGIGTNAPSYTLDVSGTGKFTNTSVTSMGTLIIAGPGSSTYLPATTTIGQLMSIYGPGGSNVISNIDLSTFIPSSSAMRLPSVRFSMTDLGSNNSTFNILTKNAGSTGTMASRIFINGSGNIGIGTTNPSYNLDVTGTLNATNVTMSSLFISTGNVNVSGISTQFAASFAAENNVVLPTDVTGFSLSNSVFGSFTSIINVKLVTSQNLIAQYYIEGVQSSTGWFINDSTLGDDVGITFSITSSGQLQYTSSNQVGWIRTTINYQVTAIKMD